MRGTIEQAKHSKSGKSLGVLIQGVWYTTRHFVLESKVGQEIVFDPKSLQMKDGGTIQTINEYSVVGEQPVAPPSSAPASAPRPVQASPTPNPYQPLVSNLAAHLIAAGGKPDDLPRWYEVCTRILEGVALPSPCDRPHYQRLTAKLEPKTEELDDDIPF